jgi:integrase/recombinase XerC
MFKDRFFSFLEHEKRYSPLTVAAYKCDLGQFITYLSDHYEINDIKLVSHQMIRSWIVSMIENNISNRSVNRKVTTLKSYFKFLTKEKLAHRNPMVKIISPKTARKLPVFVEESNMATLLDKIEFPTDFIGVRDKLILEVFYSTGIRLSELINLKRSNIDMDNNTLKVVGKGSKERILPISKQLSENIVNYLDLSIPSEWLFLTKKGKKMYPKLVYRVVYSYLSKVTTVNKKSPHILRHTFATHMLNNGADLNAIKEFLGHADLSATQVYTHNTIKKLTAVYNQAHPKA